MIIKVRKSQKHFFWNSIAQKTNKIFDKILPLSNISFFWAMEFQEKMVLRFTDLLLQQVQYLSIFEKVCCKIISSSGTLNTDALTNKQIHTSKEHFLTLSSFWGCVYSKNIFVLSRSSRTNCIKTKLNRHWLDFLTTGDQKRHPCIFPLIEKKTKFVYKK